MEYASLGASGIKVSKLCLGTMTWGEQNSESEAHAQMEYAVEQGINFFDAAEMYPVPPRPETQGATERYIGSWFSKRRQREKIVLATKVAGPGDWLSHIRGGPTLSESHLKQALDASLSRLQTDYVDLYQIHWPSRSTNYFGELSYQCAGPAEDPQMLETLSTIKAMIASGKIRAWGLSNETPWGVAECVRLCRELDMPVPASIQNPYNLLNRTYEVGLAEFSHRWNIPLLAYSPLAFGVLSGKYLNGARPEGARITLFSRFSRYTHDKAEQAVQAYADLAAKYEVSLVDLSLAFVTGRPFVASNIIGATNLGQLKENIDSVLCLLSEDLVAELEEVHREHVFPCP